MSRNLNYDAAGATEPATSSWGLTPSAYRRYERTAQIGRGSAHWDYALAELLRWGVKTRSGFTVTPHQAGVSDATVREDTDYTLTAHVGPIRIHEPVRVIAVSKQADRCGFAYGTLEGHPVSGEEAFIVHRTPDGTIWLTLRSLTRHAQGLWRLAFPAILVAQRWYRWRYLRALTRPERDASAGDEGSDVVANYSNPRCHPAPSTDVGNA